MAAASIRILAASSAALSAFALAACSAPPARGTPLALEAPVLGPPGDLPVAARIQWWQELLPALASSDRDEAQLRLGQLFLDAGDPIEARQAFREASFGWLSARELAQAEFGIGLSYLIEERVDAATPHLAAARDGLAGPEAEECAFLLAASRGESRAADPGLLARLERFLPETLRPVAAAAPAASPLLALIDVPRAQWYALPMKGNRDPMEPPWRLTVHHSAEPLVADTLAASKAEVRRIQQFHQDGRGWADLGYHFLIDRAGRVFEGRPIAWQGAHANGDNNRGNVGICLLGNFAADPQRGREFAVPQAPTSAQLAALRELVESARAGYGIPRSQVWGHSDLRETECPGPELLRWVNRYRAGG